MEQLSTMGFLMLALNKLKVTRHVTWEQLNAFESHLRKVIKGGVYVDRTRDGWAYVEDFRWIKRDDENGGAILTQEGLAALDESKYFLWGCIASCSDIRDELLKAADDFFGPSEVISKGHRDNFLE